MRITRPKPPTAFAALKHRNFRLLWTGNLISQSGDWMDLIAFNWLVYSLTDSTLQLAFANALRALPALGFTLVGGVFADRMERRKLLFSTQLVMMVFAFALAATVSFGSPNIWLIYLIALGRGIATAINQPARQSLISELVPEEDLANAVALNSATANLTRVIGPAIGGTLIATVGVTGAFYLNAFSFLAVLYGLVLMQFPAWVPRKNKRSVLSDIGDGFNYLKNEAGLRTLVVLALVPMVLGQPYQTMLTVFAKDVFETGGSGLGLMQSTAALGAVIGALAVASSRQSSSFHWRMLAGLVFFGIMLLLFAVAPTMWIALPILLLIGLSNQTYQTSNNTLIQMTVAPEYRGRIISLLFLRRGLLPLGTVFAGVIASAFGPQVAVGSMAVSMILVSVLVAPKALPALEELGNRMKAKATAADEAATATIDQKEPHPVGGGS